MPNKCGIINCKGNYNSDNKCRVFKLPNNETDRQEWINKIPPRHNFVIDPSKFVICEKHWPKDTPYTKTPGGYSKPSVPPTIFEVPSSCLPSPKPAPRPPKVEDKQLEFFLEKDKIKSFKDFLPDKELLKKYDNCLVSRTKERCLVLFMSPDNSETIATIIIHNKSTLCSPLTVSAYKTGVRVILSKLLGPNNGLTYYSQFYEAVNQVLSFEISLQDVVGKSTTLLNKACDIAEATDFDCIKTKKLKFLTRQLCLFNSKDYTVQDYCFALESFPNCAYNQLREFLILPSKRKLQYITSSTDVDNVLQRTFEKSKNSQQRHCFLLIDEVKIRPTISFSGGVLSGMAKNNPEFKATSMLCVMMKGLHGAPSLMISVTPVHKLTASFQYGVVKDAALKIENSGGVVIGSITDNHKINQLYCKLFSLTSDHEALHPLNHHRQWFLLFDNVHLLKCIRNNWITEKKQEISFDGEHVACFSDVKTLYECEKNSILKTTPLTSASVTPSKLQLQNVKHVLNVFNDKVAAALRLEGKNVTADFIQLVVDWWNTVNVSGKGLDIRFKDLNRSVQDETSFSLEKFLDIFANAESGQGPSRVQCLTHDTKKALVQTTAGIIDVCRFLFSNGFKYVLLREIQSDRIEGEFSVYRQSNGANSFMLVGDVFNAFKKRLSRFAASYLNSIETVSDQSYHHQCSDIDYEDVSAIENCIKNIELTGFEENAAAYVAGWIEFKCAKELEFDENELFLSSGVKQFIEEVSRGGLSVPHQCTYEFVRNGLCVVKYLKEKVCCRQKLIQFLFTISIFYDSTLSSKNVLRRLANVLLNGLHKLEQDHARNSTLYQTSIKKARLAD